MDELLLHVPIHVTVIGASDGGGSCLARRKDRNLREGSWKGEGGDREMREEGRYLELDVIGISIIVRIDEVRQGGGITLHRTST
jgi:hypothetical protein